MAITIYLWTSGLVDILVYVSTGRVMYINQWGVYLDKVLGRCIRGAADRVIHVELLTRPSGSAKTKMMKELLRMF
jgi:hypothetical protein